jgi:hypothetical protein
VTLFDRVFVDPDGFLAIFRRAVGMPCFFGEDFEEAEVDGLCGWADDGQWVDLPTVSCDAACLRYHPQARGTSSSPHLCSLMCCFSCPRAPALGEENGSVRLLLIHCRHSCRLEETSATAANATFRRSWGWLSWARGFRRSCFCSSWEKQHPSALCLAQNDLLLSFFLLFLRLLLSQRNLSWCSRQPNRVRSQQALPLETTSVKSTHAQVL